MSLTAIPHCRGGEGQSHIGVILLILSRCLHMSEVLIHMHVMSPRAQEQMRLVVLILHHPLSTTGFDTQYIIRRGFEDIFQLDMKGLRIHPQHQGHRIVALEKNRSIIGLHHHG